MKRILIVFAVAFSLLACTACFNSSPDEQQIPWGGPADWEHGGPGFGGGGF